MHNFAFVKKRTGSLAIWAFIIKNMPKFSIVICTPIFIRYPDFKHGMDFVTACWNAEPMGFNLAVWDNHVANNQHSFHYNSNFAAYAFVDLKFFVQVQRGKIWIKIRYIARPFFRYNCIWNKSSRVYDKSVSSDFLTAFTLKPPYKNC